MDLSEEDFETGDESIEGGLSLGTVIIIIIIIMAILGIVGYFLYKQFA